ncbi:uncharacterized protein [Bemisia tabaci]|uniref:uncharacterized protein n=1 Tax=Bemisia tabaci TaxID=7038 RepID=UPI0008F9D243|nr:PREDICTED: uncharacterized protein LOC109043441 [Bemisia tabaci]
MILACQQDCKKSSQVKGARVFSIQSTVSTTPWLFKIFLPKDILSRTRVGHGRFAAYLRRINLCDSILCFCGQIATIDHILLQCKHLINLQTLFDLLSQAGVYFLTNSAVLLANRSKNKYSINVFGFDMFM